MSTPMIPSELSKPALADLTSFRQTPCVSLFQSTHRRHPENQQDPIRFRHLLKQAESSLRQNHPAEVAKSVLEPFEALAHDREFWNHTRDGLAVLGAPGFFRVFRLQRGVPELSVVADSFHTKPLRQLLQSVDRYQVLGLSLQKAQLFEGNRDALDSMSMAAQVPQTLQEALGDELTSPHATVASYGGVGAGHGAMHHGHGGRKDEKDADAERFFRAVDRAVLEHHSQPSGLPLLLAALPEHHNLFRQVSHNPQLMGKGLTMNPETLTLDELRQRAWEIVAPHYRAQQDEWREVFGLAAAKGAGSDDLREIAVAAAQGRVAMVLLESGRHIGGRLNEESGEIQTTHLGDSEFDDLLDDIGALVEKRGGVVHVLPVERMPAATGAAATYRH